MIDVISEAAEQIMGFERKRCDGSLGGGNIHSDGTGESWFHCRWCGAQQDYDLTSPLCSKYPFPRFTMQDLMAKLGEMGHHVLVRFDPARDKFKWTVMLASRGRVDTDMPLETLCHEALAMVRSKMPYEGYKITTNTTFDPLLWNPVVPETFSPTNANGDHIDAVDEFVAWDSLSDDALSSFERALQSEGPDLEIMCDALILCLKIFNRVVLPRLADQESWRPPRKPLWATQKATYEGER